MIKQNTVCQYFIAHKTRPQKGAKEIFDRSVKQFYIIILGLIATILVFTNDKNSKNKFNKTLIFLIGLFCIVLSEINSEFLNISPLNNILLIMLPLILSFFSYLFLLSLSKRSI